MTVSPAPACELCGAPASSRERNCRGIARRVCARCYAAEQRLAARELAEVAAYSPSWRRVLAREAARAAKRQQRSALRQMEMELL